MRSQFYSATQTWPISATLRGKNKVTCNCAHESHSPQLFSLAISPEGGLGVTGGVDGQLRIWETRDGSIRVLVRIFTFVTLAS